MQCAQTHTSTRSVRSIFLHSRRNHLQRDDIITLFHSLQYCFLLHLVFYFQNGENFALDYHGKQCGLTCLTTTYDEIRWKRRTINENSVFARERKNIEISHVVLPMQISNYFHFFCAMHNCSFFAFFSLCGRMAYTIMHIYCI